MNKAVIADLLHHKHKPSVAVCLVHIALLLINPVNDPVPLKHLEYNYGHWLNRTMLIPEG